MAGALLEANLKRVVPGVRYQFRKSFKVAIELRERPQQVDQRDLGVVVDAVRQVEGGARCRARRGVRIEGRAKHGLERIVDRIVELRVEVDGVELLGYRRSDEVPVAGTRVSSKRQMSAAIGGVVHCD